MPGMISILNFTKMDGDVSSEYSISASASAVWQRLHQWMGLRPRYTEPSRYIRLNTFDAFAS